MSLKWRLMLLFAGATLLVWLAVGAYLYRSALHEVDSLYDIHLAQSARLLMGLADTVAEHGDLEQLAALLSKLVPAAPPWTHVLDEQPVGSVGDYPRTIAFQLLDRHGSVLVASENAPESPLADGAAGFSNRFADSVRWRVYGVADPARGLALYAGEDHAVREQLARHLVGHLLLPTLLAVPPLLLLFWLSVERGLAPLAHLAREIAARDQRDLDPLRTAKVPPEVKPLVSALDSLFGRLKRALASERQFTGNAAHELRTPVAALRIQAQVAHRATDDGPRRHALERIVTGAGYAGHLVDQLLTLSRLDAQDGVPTASPVNLLEVALRTAGALESLARERGVTLRVAGAEDALTWGDDTCFGILMRNLMDNAIRYTPSGGEAQVTVANAGPFNRLIVEDTGPGVADGEYAELFERFRRGSETTVPGSGLGLSIVQRICELYGGSAMLKNRREGGLHCEVRLPAIDRSKDASTLSGAMARAAQGPGLRTPLRKPSGRHSRS